MYLNDPKPNGATCFKCGAGMALTEERNKDSDTFITTHVYECGECENTWKVEDTPHVRKTEQ